MCKCYSKFLRLPALALGLFLASISLGYANVILAGSGSIVSFNKFLENGITATSFDHGNPSPFSSHLDDGGVGSATSELYFETGKRFNAISFIIRQNVFPRHTEYCTVVPYQCGLPFDNVLVQGFRDNTLVAEDKFFMGDGPLTDYFFSALFSDLDQLMIGVIPPDFATIGGFCMGSPCGHFSVTNVALQPIPIPFSLPLFGSGLALLGFAARRKRPVTVQLR